jgi:membrane-associated phospholipid phosphatase
MFGSKTVRAVFDSFLEDFMFALYTRKRLNLAVLACFALIATIIVSTLYSGMSTTAVVAIGVGFITIALLSVITASRDKVTTMSLLPVWRPRESEAGTK